MANSSFLNPHKTPIYSVSNIKLLCFDNMLVISISSARYPSRINQSVIFRSVREHIPVVMEYLCPKRWYFCRENKNEMNNIKTKITINEFPRRVQDARHLSNPTRNERSECRVGYAASARGCVSETHYYHQRRTSSTAIHVVACILHAGIRIASSTPHCAPLRSACMGLLRFRSSGTRRKKITKQ